MSALDQHCHQIRAYAILLEQLLKEKRYLAVACLLTKIEKEAESAGFLANDLAYPLPRQESSHEAC